MAEYYCDHGAYGLDANRLGLDTPAWGVPQEGDGSTKDAATASAVGSIVLNALPAAGNLLSICGITFGATSGGTVNYTIGATITATVDNIVAAINGCSTTVGASVANGTPQLRNLVYARNLSGTTVQIMMRIGSATLNYANNTNVGMTSSGWGTAPTITNFAGGSGGCWGWFINPAAMGVSSSIGIFAYGAFLALPYVVPAAITIDDTVWVRTGGGASKSIVLTFTTNTTFTHAAYSKCLVFDTNTVWTSDAADGKLKVRFYVNGWNLTNTLRLAYGVRAEYIALARGGFELEYYLTQNQGTMSITESSGANFTSALYLKNVTFRDTTTTAPSGNGLSFLVGGSSTAYVSRVWEDCDFVVTNARSSIFSRLFSLGGYATVLSQQYIGCTFDFNIFGVSDPGQILDTSYQNEVDILFKDCQFLGFAGGFDLLTSPGSWNTSGVLLSLTVDNCTGLKMPSSYIGLPASTQFVRQNVHQIVFSNTGVGAQAGLRIEDNRGVAEWVPDDAVDFPTLSATLQGSNAPYSLRLLWIRGLGLNRPRPWRSPDFRMFHQLADGIRTLTLRVFSAATLVQGIQVSFAYIDSSGVSRYASVQTPSASGASWTNAGLYPGYVAQEFFVTTEYSIKANSEITAFVTLFAEPPGAASVVPIYVDPEFVVA